MSKYVIHNFKFSIDKKEIYFLPVFLLTNAFNKGDAEKKNKRGEGNQKGYPKNNIYPLNVNSNKP